MSEKQRYEIAKEYVDKQLDTMKQHGSAPQKLTKQEYDSLVKKIAETVRT